MLQTQMETHRTLATLKDGANVCLRFMTRDDEYALIDLFAPASDEDVRYLRDIVRDPGVVRGWCKNLDYADVLPLLAFVRSRAVGQATLHFGIGPERHIAKLRIYLAKDFRRRGLGIKMIRALVEIARKHDLRIITAEVVTDQSKVIKALKQIGFKMYCTLDDYFMLPDGDTRDIAVLMYHLAPDLDEF